MPAGQDDEAAAVHLRPLDAVARHLLAQREAAREPLPEHTVKPNLHGWQGSILNRCLCRRQSEMKEQGSCLPVLLNVLPNR